MNHQGPPHSGTPQQMNPALAGFPQQSQQPLQPQQQAPQQPPPTPAPSGIVDPYTQRPLSAQPTAWLALAHRELAVPVPVGPDGQLTVEVCRRLEQLAGPIANAHPHIIITWHEVQVAFGSRDTHLANHDVHLAWLQRRIEDLEKKLGVEPIEIDAFMREKEVEYRAALEEKQRQDAQATGAAVPPQQAQPVPQGPLPGASGPLSQPGGPQSGGQ